MTDDLTISGGGSSLVATDTVFAEMATMRRLQGDAEAWQSRLAGVRGLGVGAAPGWQPDGLGACVFTAERAVDQIIEHSREVADRLGEAAERYGRLEDGLQASLRGTGAWLGHALGTLAPLLLRSLAVPAVMVAGSSLLANAALGRSPSPLPPLVADALRDNPRQLSNPAVVALVRTLASSADDAALGALGVPYPVAALLGDDGVGALGAPSSALAVLIAARTAGLLRETPVRVHRVSPPGAGRGPTGSRVSVGQQPGPATSTGPGGRTAAGGMLPASPPAGVAALAERIPSLTDDGGQVRVERYGDPEHPSWLVYIGGTVEWSPLASDEPWDMASNVAAVAEQEAGSYRAVQQALHAAGVRPGDPLVPIGHSQGGLIAAQLAASADWNTVGLVTFGAPAGQVVVPAELPAIAVEHAEDIVPALGGTSAEGDGRLYVRREVFAGAAATADGALPAHQLVEYRGTAELIDESPDPRLRDFRARLHDLVGDGEGQTGVWRADRVG